VLGWRVSLCSESSRLCVVSSVEEEQEERTVLARAASPVRRPPLSKQGRAQQCRAELEGDLVSTSSDATTMCGGTALYVYGC
jgi:hypothetical protein